MNEFKELPRTTSLQANKGLTHRVAYNALCKAFQTLATVINGQEPEKTPQQAETRASGTQDTERVLLSTIRQMEMGTDELVAMWQLIHKELRQRGLHPHVLTLALKTMHAIVSTKNSWPSQTWDNGCPGRAFFV